MEDRRLRRVPAMRLKHRIWEVVNLKGEVKLADSGLRLFFLVAPRKIMIRVLCIHLGQLKQLWIFKCVESKNQALFAQCQTWNNKDCNSSFTFIRWLQCARSPKCIDRNYVIWSSPSLQQVWLAPFYRWEDQELGRVSNLPRVIKLEGSRTVCTVP